MNCVKFFRTAFYRTSLVAASDYSQIDIDSFRPKFEMLQKKSKEMSMFNCVLK